MCSNGIRTYLQYVHCTYVYMCMFQSSALLTPWGVGVGVGARLRGILWPSKVRTYFPLGVILTMVVMCENAGLIHVETVCRGKAHKYLMM